MPSGMNWRGPQVRSKVVSHVENVFNWGRVNVEAEVKRLIGKRGAGRVGQKGAHSKPGNPPFRQAGRLINSIASVLIKKTKNIIARIGSTLKPEKGQPHSVALYLEEGTPGGQMEARPYLKRALRKWQKVIFRKLRMR